VPDVSRGFRLWSVIHWSRTTRRLSSVRCGSRQRFVWVGGAAHAPARARRVSFRATSLRSSSCQGWRATPHARPRGGRCAARDSPLVVVKDNADGRRLGSSAHRSSWARP
jgi:hypothetical protein